MIETMDPQATTASTGVDWTSVINSTIAQVPSWIAIARNQPVPTAVPPGTTGGSVQFGSGGAAFSFSPGLILVGVLGIVALVYVLKR